MNSNVDGNDSLEEGEIPSPSPSPRLAPKTACVTSALHKNDKRRRRRHERSRSRSNKCSHCGRSDSGRDVVDDFDQMRNKYFLRLRQEKAARKSRDFLSRLPRIAPIARDKVIGNNQSQKNSIEISDDDADIDKLRDQALESQLMQPPPKDSEEELDEFSLRAEALKTALVKKSRGILNKKKAKSVDEPSVGSPSNDNHPEPMECDNEGKENESLDEKALRQQLLENLVRRRENQTKVNVGKEENLPLSPNENSLNMPSTSKVSDKIVKPPVVVEVPKPNPKLATNQVPVRAPVKKNSLRLINNHNNVKTAAKKEPERIVVQLGPDSSDDESEPESKKLPVKTDQIVESKITEFLLNARRRTEEKNKSTLAVSNHLPLPQRIEYCRLKKELAEKELKLKSNQLGASQKPVPKVQPTSTPKEKQTLTVANKLLTILKREEAHERRSREELARLRMQIGFVEQKMLAHAKNAVRVRTRLKSLLLNSKKLVKSKTVPNQSVAVKDMKPTNNANPQPAPGSKEFSSYESPLNQTDSVPIDPLLELCPHDLAGECRDPHCKYQHTRIQPGPRDGLPPVG